MAYNFFPTGYQPYSIAPQQNTQQGGIIWVQGEASAKSYLVAPNSSVALWDSEDTVIYLKSADASGMPSIRTLDYTMREEASKTGEIQPKTDFATKDDILRIQGEIDALREDLKPKKTKVSER